MAATANLLDEVLRLPPEERARLAVELIRSLDAESDEDAEAQWTAEIERRSTEVAGGIAPTMTLGEYREHVRARRAARSRR